MSTLGLIVNMRGYKDFAILIRQLLRVPLWEWAENPHEPGLMQRQGYLRPEPIQILWS